MGFSRFFVWRGGEKKNVLVNNLEKRKYDLLVFDDALKNSESK